MGKVDLANPWAYLSLVGRNCKISSSNESGKDRKAAGGIKMAGTSGSRALLASTGRGLAAHTAAAMPRRMCHGLTHKLRMRCSRPARVLLMLNVAVEPVQPISTLTCCRLWLAHINMLIVTHSAMCDSFCHVRTHITHHVPTTYCYLLFWLQVSLTKFAFHAQRNSERLWNFVTTAHQSFC